MHAAAITSNLTQLRQAKTVTMLSFYAYCHTVAGSIHALSAESRSPSLNIFNSQDVLYNDSLTALTTLAQNWPCAEKMRNKLEMARKSLDKLGILHVNEAQGHHQSQEDVQHLWDVLDYSSMSSADPDSDGVVPVGEVDVFDPSDELGSSFLDFLSQQPDLGREFWGLTDDLRMASQEL